MPCLTIATNARIGNAESFNRAATELVSEITGKAAAYCMVVTHAEAAMAFGGSGEPAAFMELRAIGLDEGSTDAFSARLCAFAREELGVAPKRVFIVFHNVPRQLWGYDGGNMVKD